ncbi:CAMK family protein kinase [Histomonas meleagridis]|uniref:CAMK family protein kinase n=1 Tax=Histomonas meleagridis TaxID=135588 RepID=UPI003559B33F|nr:CAMK family protein kinase [Histomonas meleagridis]KAH0800901.1 CAMK family protein kinase [Histomonas meleagridis]
MSSWACLPPFIGKYNLGHTLGKGSFSLVKEGQDIETHTKYAVKIIPKANMNTAADIERFEREVRVVLNMDHPGIIKIYDFLLDSSFFYLIMELCKGDTLMTKLSQPGLINEESAKHIFKQILDTVKYIHAQGIAHRDLKPENVLMDPNGNIKIIDFGFSRFANPGQMCATPCGSPAYAAPEIIDGQSYDGRAADMWSCGVILYCLVTGELPWRGTNQVVIFKQIKSGIYEIPDHISMFCRDLITKLLNPDSVSRLSATEAYGHPWLDGVEAKWDTGNSAAIKPAITERTFVRLLSNSNEQQTAAPIASPRTILKQMGTRMNRTRTTSNASKGSFSFGAKTPSPMGSGMMRFGGSIVRDSSGIVRRNSFIKN